jgi:formylglycine-generating enzyme required for sulfatase activity|tara:strand:+ start:732 stop:1007 length:276 start_codon:yes stop_codon:yes gene_type:complete
MGSSQKPIHRIKQFDFDYPNERLACEHPQRQIYLSQFEIGIYLVTNHQFGFSVDNAGYQAGRELDRLGKSVWSARSAISGKMVPSSGLCNL